MNGRDMAVWVSPKGKVYDFSVSHAQAVVSNPSLFGLTPEQAKKDYYTIEDVVVEKGWVRIGVESGWKHINLIVKKDGSVNLDLARMAIVELGLHEHNGRAIIHITTSNQANILKNVRMEDFLKSEDVFESFSSLCNLVESSPAFGNAFWFHPEHGWIDVGEDHHYAIINPKNDKYFAKIRKSTTEGFWVTSALKYGWIQVRKYPFLLVLNLNKLNAKTRDYVYDICKELCKVDTPVKIFELSHNKISDTTSDNITKNFDFGDDLNEAKLGKISAYWFQPKTNELILVPRGNSHIHIVVDNPEIFGLSRDFIRQTRDNYDILMGTVFNSGWYRVNSGVTDDLYIQTTNRNSVERNLKKLVDEFGISYCEIEVEFSSKTTKKFVVIDGEVKQQRVNESHDFNTRELESVVDGFVDEIRDHYNLQRLEIFLDTRYKNTICLDKIQVRADDRRSGIGSAAMKDICAFADEYRFNIWLTLANPEGTDKSFGTESVEKLINFYSRFGFVVNTGAKGRGMKVPYICDMYRKPR